MSQNNGPAFIEEIISDEKRGYIAVVKLVRGRIKVGRQVEEAVARFTDEFQSIDVKMNRYDGKITVTLHSATFEPIGDVLRWFAERSFTQKSKLTESPASQTRTYYLDHGVNVVLQLPKVATAEPQCRYVQTGVEMVEKPIYELQCDGDETADKAIDEADDTDDVHPF